MPIDIFPADGLQREKHLYAAVVDLTEVCELCTGEPRGWRDPAGHDLVERAFVPVCEVERQATERAALETELQLLATLRFQVGITNRARRDRVGAARTRHRREGLQRRECGRLAAGFAVRGAQSKRVDDTVLLPK